jgi:hypothetical protein
MDAEVKNAPIRPWTTEKKIAGIKLKLLNSTTEDIDSTPQLCIHSSTIQNDKAILT